MASEIFRDLLRNAKPENRQFVEKNVAICKQIRKILSGHPTIRSQSDLARALGKEPSEISRWLNGLHNIGLENITRMEAILGQDIILTTDVAKARFGKPDNSGFQTYKVIRLNPIQVKNNALDFKLNQPITFTPCSGTRPNDKEDGKQKKA